MNEIDLKGKSGVVTGGAQGIGLAVAQRLLASGATVVLWDIDAQRLPGAVQQLTAAGGTASAEVVALRDTTLFVMIGLADQGIRELVSLQRACLAQAL